MVIFLKSVTLENDPDLGVTNMCINEMCLHTKYEPCNLRAKGKMLCLCRQTDNSTTICPRYFNAGWHKNSLSLKEIFTAMTNIS